MENRSGILKRYSFFLGYPSFFFLIRTRGLDGRLSVSVGQMYSPDASLRTQWCV